MFFVDPKERLVAVVMEQETPDAKGFHSFVVFSDLIYQSSLRQDPLLAFNQGRLFGVFEVRRQDRESWHQGKGLKCAFG